MRLRGEAPNTQAIGAKVELAAERFQIRNRVAAGGVIFRIDTLLVLPGAAQQDMTLRISGAAANHGRQSNEASMKSRGECSGAPDVRASERRALKRRNSESEASE